MVVKIMTNGFIMDITELCSYIHYLTMAIIVYCTNVGSHVVSVQSKSQVTIGYMACRGHIF